MPPGKRSRPEPDPATLQHLRELFEAHQQADTDARRAMDELAVAATEACDDKGLSFRQVAAALGAGSTTVHDWVRHGRRLRAASPE